MIAKYIDEIIRKTYNAKIQRTGEVLVEVKKPAAGNHTSWSDENGRSRHQGHTPPKPNGSKAVISDADLLNETDADLLEGLKDQGVTALRRITMRTDSKKIPTKH